MRKWFTFSYFAILSAQSYLLAPEEWRLLAALWGAILGLVLSFLSIIADTLQRIRQEERDV
ncbi:hypothetical protein Rvan_1453 [Rhodomicrobium vannielii ATCC 17100]|uniref:Uncharacterized protein n=1 Tax=Rhodomicrobium vannielii (strain ATCC 17100 / DSM 162 / LMG 4299 / NCIMB 10020 / ATH 3.1.1) TaxID=648757 RepID=E3I757_RHOVT|nr:hypothetical protein Rvan_1453 [Rhodomicrobium vannielii ATCC 17100]